MLATAPEIRTITINDRTVMLSAEATVRDAIRTFDHRYVSALEQDAAEVMDAAGWPLQLDAPASKSNPIYVAVLPWEETGV